MEENNKNIKGLYEEDENDELKPVINNLIWMNSDGNLTLDECEEMAVKIYELILCPKCDLKEILK